MVGAIGMDRNGTVSGLNYDVITSIDEILVAKWQSKKKINEEKGGSGLE